MVKDLTQDSGDYKNTFLAQGKLFLRPLMFITILFMEARTSLRKKAIKRFDSQNPHVLQLLKSSLFSQGVFRASNVQALVTTSQSLTRPMAQMIEFSSVGKRTSSANSSGGESKKSFKKRKSLASSGSASLGDPRPTSEAPSPRLGPSDFQNHYSSDRKPKRDQGKGNGQNRQPFHPKHWLQKL